MSDLNQHLHKVGGEYTVVHTEDERDQKLAEGWYLSVPEAEAAAAVGLEPSDDPVANEPAKRGRKPKA